MSAAAAALPPRSFPFAAADADQGTEDRRLDPRLLAEVGPVAGQLRCATSKPEFNGERWMAWARTLPGPGTPVVAVILRARRERPHLAVLAEARELTRAEIRIIEMMIGGTDTAAIAGALQISVETVRTHVKRAYRKLGVTSRGELFAAIADFLQP
jgi:DNA-binding CsgD family transcriptional regulator